MSWRVPAEAGVLELVERLPERQRRAVRSRVIEGRGYDQIARVLKSTELVVAENTSRGLRRLRDELTEREL